MLSPFLRAIHRAASIGWVYDSIQFFAGEAIAQRRLQTYLADCRGRVLDIGGGTGRVARLGPAGCSYTCLDNELPKLQRCAQTTSASPLLADATCMPIQSRSVDVVTCIAVTHHLKDDQIEEFLRESARVLRTNGSLILMDAILKPTRLPGRILWALDRGAHPRPEAVLRQAIERHFSIERWDRFAIYHEYVITTCRGSDYARLHQADASRGR